MPGVSERCGCGCQRIWLSPGLVSGNGQARSSSFRSAGDSCRRLAGLLTIADNVAYAFVDWMAVRGRIGAVKDADFLGFVCGAVVSVTPAPRRRKRVLKKSLLLFGGAGVLLAAGGGCHTVLIHVNEILQLWGALNQLGFV